MAAKIARVRVINRRTSQSRAIDPAQNGAYYARFTNVDKLTVTGLQGRTVLRQQGVIAAKWEPQADETILLVLREDPEDEPIVVHAFRPREGGNWETEDAQATAHISPDERFVALQLTLPNHAITVLTVGRVAREFDARANLSSPQQSVAWSEDGRTLSVKTAEQSLVWTPGKSVFVKG